MAEKKILEKQNFFKLLFLYFSTMYNYLKFPEGEKMQLYSQLYKK